MTVDCADERDQDRRQQDEEAPEDDGVQCPRDEPLEELPLAEHDLGLCAKPLRHVVEPLDRLAQPYEPPEQPRAPCEERSRHGEERREDERCRENRYVPLTFLISAEIAGRIS